MTFVHLWAISRRFPLSENMLLDWDRDFPVLPRSNNFANTVPYNSDVERNGYTFSDGIGMVSYDIARKVQKAMGLEHLPSAMQIRIGGSKGVVSLRPASVSTPMGKELLLRPSMTKFAGNPDHQELEVCSVAKSVPCYVNRQVITVLS